MARLYLIKYGYRLADNEDLAADVTDPPDSAADVVVHETVSDEEADFRSRYFKTLREKIGRWYRSQYGSLLKSDKAAFKELFTGVLDGAPPKPQRPQLLHFYSRKYYDTLIKPVYEARLAKEKRTAKRTGGEEPKELTLRNAVTQEMWDEETPARQKEIKDALEREHQLKLKGWKASLADSPTRTAEEMSTTLDNAAYYLQPFVDAVAERFGMCASVLLCGPIGKRGGIVGMQSVHAGLTKGLAPEKWPKFDPVGFQEVEKVMVTFAKECFSEAECRARAVKSSAGAAGAPPPVASGSKSRGTSVGPDGAEGWGDVDVDMDGGGGNASPVNTTSGTGAASTHASSGNPASGTGSPSAHAGSRNATGTGVASAHAGSGNTASGTGSASANAGSVNTASGMGSGGEKDGAAAVDQAIERLWRRDDRDQWSSELGKAHAAFARGKMWGEDWAACVVAFLDFEGVCGYDDNGGKISTKERPKVVKDWIARARNWNASMAIGTIGSAEEEGTYVNQWWKWWKLLQPSDRLGFAGLMSCPSGDPESDEWKALAKLHGKNGWLQVMASLLWWGDEVGDGSEPARHVDWTGAVREVEYMLKELKDVVKAREKGKAKGKKRGRGRAGREGDGDDDDDDDDEEEEEEEMRGPQRKKSRKKIGDETTTGHQTRSKAGSARETRSGVAEKKKKVARRG
ncbi:hypothetical protein B0H11DRAFT_2252646 [Mycena galericulata]|nr:hypothetical protein B0H11DRAFT_2252646 [Mycena galericulata]